MSSASNSIAKSQASGSVCISANSKPWNNFSRENRPKIKQGLIASQMPSGRTDVTAALSAKWKAMSAKQKSKYGDRPMSSSSSIAKSTSKKRSRPTVSDNDEETESSVCNH